MELFLCRNIAAREQVYDLLAWAVRHRWGMEHLPHIARKDGGKPYFPQWSDRQFNLSHSGSFALCVLDEQEVGADIERVRAHHPGVAQRSFNEAQLAWISRQPDRERAFSQLWSYKESAVKYTGVGLTVPIREIAIPLPPEQERDGILFHGGSTPDYGLCACGRTPLEGITLVRAEEFYL